MQNKQNQHKVYLTKKQNNKNKQMQSKRYLTEMRKKLQNKPKQHKV